MHGASPIPVFDLRFNLSLRGTGVRGWGRAEEIVAHELGVYLTWKAGQDLLCDSALGDQNRCYDG